MLTDQDLARIEAGCREALPGPWIVTRLAATGICTVLYPHDGYGTAVARVFEPADAAFVAACREDLPALVSELRRLREAVRRVVIQKGDDLCWRDVYTELASLLPDPPTVDHTPPTDLFLRNCQRFEASMRSGQPYVPETAHDEPLPAQPGPLIAEEDEIL